LFTIGEIKGENESEIIAAENQALNMIFFYRNTEKCRQYR
jgi:hypothetical protein